MSDTKIRYSCPVDRCLFRVDEDLASPDPQESDRVEQVLVDHAGSHKPQDFLATINRLRNEVDGERVSRGAASKYSPPAPVLQR